MWDKQRRAQIIIVRAFSADWTPPHLHVKQNAFRYLKRGLKEKTRAQRQMQDYFIVLLKLLLLLGRIAALARCGLLLETE